MLKNYLVTFDYCVNVEAKDEAEARERAIEVMVKIDPPPCEMNTEIEDQGPIDKSMDERTLCSVCFEPIDTEVDAFQYVDGEYYCQDHMSPETAELEQ